MCSARAALLERQRHAIGQVESRQLQPLGKPAAALARDDEVILRQVVLQQIGHRQLQPALLLVARPVVEQEDRQVLDELRLGTLRCTVLPSSPLSLTGRVAVPRS